jgi:hypothetical protein
MTSSHNFSDEPLTPLARLFIEGVCAVNKPMA